MCGRYVVTTTFEAVEKKFNVKSTFSEFPPNYNLAPSNFGPVITSDDPTKLQLFRFGYTPLWNEKKLLINARGENLLTKRMWKQLYTTKRCLVIADAFMEGPEMEKLSKPYLVYMRDREPFTMAALYSMWVDTKTGEEIGTFAIVTTEANKLMKEIGHHRSPVILGKDIREDWVNMKTKLSDLTPWIRPYESLKMNAYPITPKIRSPKEVPASYLDPIGDQVFKEFKLKITPTLELQGMGQTSSSKRRMIADNPELSAKEEERKRKLDEMQKEILRQTDYPGE